MSRILDFLAQNGTDHKGRTIKDIWAFERWDLENNHDFIQWLFPLDTGTKFNRFAPILTEQDCVAIRQSEVTQQALKHSLDVMLNFWGLKQEQGKIIPKERLDPKKFNHFWIRRSNHNQLRMTRVIKSLAMLGQAELAFIFQQGILTIAKDYAINEETIAIWQTATCASK